MLEAFNHPPAFKVVDRRSSDFRRRSADALQLLGSMDDIQADDPCFILRRAVGLRPTNQARSKLATSLDEVALQQFHRESAASDSSQLSSNSSFVNKYHGQSTKMSRQEIITAQREASRATQQAIISAQMNAEQGVDILLPDRGTLRSTRNPDSSMRYSFIHPDGERSDISNIVEEEWDGHVASYDGNDLASKKSTDRQQDHHARAHSDLLEEALTKPRSVLQQEIDRVLTKVRSDGGGHDERESPASRSVARSASIQSRNPEQPPRSLSTTPINRSTLPPDPLATSSRSASPPVRSVSPAVQTRAGTQSTHHQQPSIASVMSDLSTYTASDARQSLPLQPPVDDRGQKPALPQFGADEMGLSRMLALIDLTASASRPAPLAQASELDKTYLGDNLTLEELHPQARELYEPIWRRLGNVDKVSLFFPIAGLC